MSNQSLRLLLLISIVVLLGSAALGQTFIDLDAGGQFTIGGGDTMTLGVKSTTQAKFGDSKGNRAKVTVKNDAMATAVTLKLAPVTKLSADIAFPDGSKEFATEVSASSKIGFKLSVVSPQDFDIDKLTISIEYDLGLSGLTLVQLAAILIGNVQPIGLQFDADANAYFALESIRTSGSYTLTFKPQWPATKDSIEMYIVAFDFSKKIPASFGFQASVKADAKSHTYSYNSGELELDIATSAAFKLMTLKKTSSENSEKDVMLDGSESASTKAVVFFDIEPSDMTAAFTGQIRYKYDASAMAGAGITDETTLRLAYFDVNANAWIQKSSGASVDKDSKIIVQDTTHFSEWAVTGRSSSAVQSHGFRALTVIFAMLAITALLL